MAINLKAKESLIQIGKYAGTYRYVLSPVIYNKLSEAKVIQEAALRSGINRGSINAAWDAIGSVIQAWATEGHSVAIPGLGSMRFGVKASSASSVEKVSSDLINARKVIFTPSVAIKKELKSTSVSIACYNRDGKLVKTVNSKNDEQGDFEVELIASPEEGGTFEGEGYYNDGDMAVIKAIPAEGYQFVKWDDDEIDAERSIVITDDISHVATFKKITAEGSNGSTGGSTGSTGSTGTTGGSTGTTGGSTDTTVGSTSSDGTDTGATDGTDAGGGYS